MTAETIPSEADVKNAIRSYSERINAAVAMLYSKFDEYNNRYLGGQLPATTIGIQDADPRTLAQKCATDTYLLTHVIMFTRAFIENNFTDQVVEVAIVELEDGSRYEDRRTVLQHTLLHEMIHLYLTAIQNETYKSAASAHGKSFRKMATWLGVQGVGRLMSCPYPVDMGNGLIRSAVGGKIVYDKDGDEVDEDEKERDKAQKLLNQLKKKAEKILADKEDGVKEAKELIEQLELLLT